MKLTFRENGPNFQALGRMININVMVAPEGEWGRKGVGGSPGAGDHREAGEKRRRGAPGECVRSLIVNSYSATHYG